jgi:hypothetical protein
MNSWLVLILSFPTENATARMRAWRTLKASGAAVLRDGVYLLPDIGSCRATLEAVAADINAGGGSAFLFFTSDAPSAKPEDYFDRGDEYASLLNDIQAVRNDLSANTALEVTKQIRKLRKAFTAISDIDFFSGAAKKKTDAAIQELELAINRVLSPNEPCSTIGDIQRLNMAGYQARTWATRRPWVDRLASAWLIRRYIDKDARFLWLESPTDCPAHALGFDFDSATFSHVGDKVTYEVLLASFGLEQPSLLRIGALVHYLDVGGVQPPESVGVESVLAGLRETIQDDDQFLMMACSVFDGLVVTYAKTPSK